MVNEYFKLVLKDIENDVNKAISLLDKDKTAEHYLKNVIKSIEEAREALEVELPARREGSA